MINILGYKITKTKKSKKKPVKKIRTKITGVFSEGKENNDFVDPRKDHHDFVKLAEKMTDEINQGKITLDDLIMNLSYSKYMRFAHACKSNLYDTLMSKAPGEKDNLKAITEAFSQNMSQKEFTEKKKEIIEKKRAEEEAAAAAAAAVPPVVPPPPPVV